MAQYADYFILAGIALCAISVIYAVIQLVQLEPPRAAVITLVLGIALLFAGAFTSPQSFSLQDIRGAWGRVSGGVEETVAPAGESGTEGESQ